MTKDDPSKTYTGKNAKTPDHHTLDVQEGEPYTPSQNPIPERQTAVAIQTQENKRRAPLITAAGRGVLAEKIINLAYQNKIKVRKDSTLVEILAQFELDSPIPSEAFGAVAEILSYVYKANNQPNPFNASINDDKE